MRLLSSTIALVGGVFLAGCASTSNDAPSTERTSFKRTDKLDKVWVADGFDFSGYNVIVVSRVKAEAIKPKDAKEQERLEMIQTTLVRDFANGIESKQIVPEVTTKPGDVNGTNRVLRLDNTIVEFTRGSSAARYTIGFGAGMPRLRVRGQLVDVTSGKPLLEYDIDETADWFGAGFTSSASLQSHAGFELADDVTAFMWAIARHKPIKYR